MSDTMLCCPECGHEVETSKEYKGTGQAYCEKCGTVSNVGNCRLINFDNYQKPVCECSGDLIFIDKALNRNLKHDIYTILKDGKKGKKVGETEDELFEDCQFYYITKCKKCGLKWKSYLDEDRRIH